MHDSQKLFVAGSAGRLEAILWTPTPPAAARFAALVCHPHPLFGGTLHNKVIYQVAKSLDSCSAAVLRFNFRGAGLSEGQHDHGRGEQDDVQAALDFLAQQVPDVPMLIAGFSFGSIMGTKVGCRDPRVQRLIALGLPVDNSNVDFLSDCPKPKLFIHGAHDEHGELKKIKALIPTLPGNNRLVIVPGVDHFFTGKLDAVDAAITSWIADS